MSERKGDEPEFTPRFRRGRRPTICAVPVTIEAGWKPTVVAKDEPVKERIREVMQNNILFSSLELSEREVIVDAMEKKVFNAGDVIIKQGDVGDFFYVVDDGSCDIFVKKDGSETKVATVKKGGSFGELALMYNAPRAATVTATEKTETWAVDQVTFKKTLMDATMKKRSRFEAFISAVPILSTLNQWERLTTADALEEGSAKAGTDILKQGDTGHRFFIIEQGEVKVTKEGVDGEVSRRLKTGDYFGERALLTNEPRAATVTAVTDVRYQSLSRATFKRLLGPLEDMMRKNMEVYNMYSDAVPREPIEEKDDDSDDSDSS